MQNELKKILHDGMIAASNTTGNLSNNFANYLILHDVIIQQKGEWAELARDNLNSIYYRCSNCHRITNYKSLYCPNCGAKMRFE